LKINETEPYIFGRENIQQRKISVNMLLPGTAQTGELIEVGLKRSRLIERSPTRRFQFVNFLMEHFHYLMGCGYALWRMFVEPKESAKAQILCLRKSVKSGHMILVGY